MPIYYQIRQILISPSGFFLAICTEHTVHIAVLPDSSRLKEQDRSPLKVKTYQLGPTIHVIPESPLASVQWHPLACATASTDCLVTVTAEAAVRLWEFDKASNWSLDRPTLAIDLRKLADGVSCDQDFEPLGFGKRRGFSVDDFDMEVSAACFGGRGGEEEDAWASMTLWIAMRNGDIYALCPLLPSRWRPSPTTIPSLTTTAISRMALTDDYGTDPDERRAAEQQYEWVQEIDSEEPEIHQSTDSLRHFETRYRPQNPSAIPRLQGPFSIYPEDEDADIEVSDIYVYPARLDEDELFGGEDDDDYPMPLSTPVPFTTICIATSDNQVSIAIDLEGVTGQWLPKKGRSAFSVPSTDATPLTLVNTWAAKEQTSASNANWPVFTPDCVHSYSLFLTTATNVYSFAMAGWVTQLGFEFAGHEPVDAGLRTRLETRVQGQIAMNDKIIEVTERTEILSAPTIIDDESLGNLLLSPTLSGSYGVIFDRDYHGALTLTPSTTEFTTSQSHLSSQLAKITEPTVDPIPIREPYKPARVFYENQQIAFDTFRKHLPPHLRKTLTESPMRLSPATLELMTFTHRVVGTQSSHLEKAAAELFRRCERLQNELAVQVQQMTELAQQLQRLSMATGRSKEPGEQTKTPEERMRLAQEKQKALVARYEVLRRKVGRVGSANRNLTTKEVAWIQEIDGLGKNVGVVSDSMGQHDGGGKERLALIQRLETAKKVAHDLVEESHELEKEFTQSPSSGPPGLEASISSISNSSITPSMSASQMTVRSTRSNNASPRGMSTAGFSVSSRVQKERIAEVMGMVEREAAVIDAAMKRLERLRLEY